MADTLPPGAKSFLFEPVSWRGSRRVQRMSYRCKGMYIELLAEQWQNGSIPATADACAALLGGDPHEWRQEWPRLRDCFPVRKARGRIANDKLDAIREERLKFVRDASAAGRRGAKTRWRNKRVARPLHGHPIGSPKGAHGHPIGSPKGSDSNRSKENISTSTREDLSTTDIRTSTVRTHSQTRARASNGRDAFDRFFALYPKRVAEADAWKAWQALKPDDALTCKILDAIAWQRHQPGWIREGGRYVPLPAKWLRDRRFDDQPTDTPHLSDSTIKLLRAGAEFLNS